MERRRDSLMDGSAAAGRREVPERARRLPILVCLWAGTLALVATPAARALDREDAVFLDYLIQELRYYDTATRYLDQLKSGRGLDRECRAEIESRELDILEATGRRAEFDKAFEDFKRKYPDHPRSALGDLQVIGAALYGKVFPKLQEITPGTDEATRDRVVGEATALFDKTVRKPFEALIAGFDKTLDNSEGKDDEARSRRNRAELTRIRFFLLFADALPSGTEERRAVLEEGLELADFFVQNRGYFYVMQYAALIQKGLYLLKLERFGDAADELEILFDIDPGVGVQADADTVRAFKELRLKALLFAARGYNGAGRHADAVRAIERHFLGIPYTPKNDPFYPKDAESDPKLKQFAVLVRLEYAVALSGAGRPREGLDVIHSIIERQSAAGEETLVNDARQALGKIAARGDVRLSGRDYYQAAIGLKSQMRLREALPILQRALAVLSPDEISEYGPLCLSEIGEVNFMLERHAESAVAFEELCVYFPLSSLRGKASQNFLGAATKALQGDPDHAGLRELEARAKKIFEEAGGPGFAIYENAMVEANRLIDQERYLEAREKYEEIPREVEGRRVPFYWRARASVHWMTYLEWERTKSAELREEFDTMLSELGKVRTEALKANEKDGAAVASLVIGQIHYQREQWAEAVDALKIFLGQLADDDFVRCGALGYLVDAATSWGSPQGESLAVDAFQAIDGDCREDPARGYGALAMADYFSAKGTKSAKNRAAVYMKIYADSPQFREVLAGQTGTEKVDTLLRIARVLIDGGLVDDAQAYILEARKVPEGGDLDRQQLYLQALILEERGEMESVVAVLEAYIDKYHANGKFFEDPYVWQKLGEAHIALDRKDDKEFSPEHLVPADRAYNNARSILYRGIQASEEKDPALEKLYWRWCYRWMNIKYVLGKYDRAAWKELVFFVDEWSKAGRTADMGGLRGRFLNLKQKAEKYLNGRSK